MCHPLHNCTHVRVSTFTSASICMYVILLLINVARRHAGEKLLTRQRYDNGGEYTDENPKPQKVPRVVPPPPLPAQAAGQPQRS